MLAAGLALAALFFAILLPPEAYPDGKLAVILCATFAFLAAMSERRIPESYLIGGLAGLAFLLFHALIISIDMYRSLEFTCVVWAYYCLFGFFRYAPFEPLKPISVSMVALCAIVSAYGIYQYFWGFDQLYNYIFYAASDQVVKVPALGLIATRRVFSTLSLPGTLWGFLVIAIPFHAALWSGGKLVRAGLVLGAALLFTTGFLTRSFGFLLGLFVLTATWMVLRYRRVAWNRIAAILIVLVLVAATFYSARKGVIEGANPVSLRMKNWVSAWSVFAANPMGTGLNTFGVAYPKFKLPDANETQYTHNTLLQLLSELGFPFLLALTGLMVLAVRGLRQQEPRHFSPYLLLALSVWAVHNVIDINVYFPSLGVLGAILIGALLRKPLDTPQQPGRFAIALTSVAALSILAFAALAMVSSELQFRAQAEYEESKIQLAVATLENAKMLMPINSSIFHDSGDMNLNLFHRRHDVKYLAVATQSFKRAVALSPQKSGAHTGLSLSLASANHVEEALEEIRIAQQLYPDSTYVQSIARLLERRRTSDLAAAKPTP